MQSYVRAAGAILVHVAKTKKALRFPSAPKTKKEGPPKPKPPREEVAARREARLAIQREVHKRSLIAINALRQTDVAEPRRLTAMRREREVIAFGREVNIPIEVADIAKKALQETSLGEDLQRCLQKVATIDSLDDFNRAMKKLDVIFRFVLRELSKEKRQTLRVVAEQLQFSFMGGK